MIALPGWEPLAAPLSLRLLRHLLLICWGWMGLALLLAALGLRHD